MEEYSSLTSIDTAHSVDDLEHNIHIDSEAIQDIIWWQKFSTSWNGKGIFLESKWTPAHNFHLYMDASSTIGYRAYWNGAWFSHTWPNHLRGKSIEWKELFAIIMACEVWGGGSGVPNAYCSIATIKQ